MDHYAPVETLLLRKYLHAKDLVLQNGYSAEIDWQARLEVSQIDESMVLREAAWVILSSGMAERTVSAVFPRIIPALDFFQSARRISQHRSTCAIRAYRIFRHGRKIDAILDICDYVATHGHKTFLALIRDAGPSGLHRFQYLGPATSCHLAKNLGFAVSKADRHIVRLAAAWGFCSAEALCGAIATLLGESVAVVDIVLWRFAVLRSRRQ
jgi:hypothetical protein